LLSPSTVLPEDSAREEPAGRLAGWKVLLVDDSPEVLETLVMLLEMEDADIQAFSDPFKALEAAEKATFDIIISDIGMPGMNGHELMQALRRLPNCATTPSVALTGYGTGQDVQQTLQSGFSCHIGKPVAYDVLIETLEKVGGELKR
jgi:two-component system CheB/CheR fusion protein